VHIRAATAEDLPHLPAIEVAAGALFRDLGMDDVADHPPPTVAELAGAAAIFVALGAAGLPVGYARIELVGGATHLEQLSVLPAHGRLGIGTALLDEVTEWARRRGDEAVTLTTFRDVAFNAPLYARRGFVEVPEAEWSDALRAVIAHEAEGGLDPATRVVMRRPVSAGAPAPPA
jgi:GNAT superfamily N-acetyltransferase